MALRRIIVVVLLALVACGEDADKRGSLTTAIGAPSTSPVVDPNSSVPIGQPYHIKVGTHCGVGMLGIPVNEVVWITDTAHGERDWMPTEWASSLGPGEQLIGLEVVLSDDATLTATAVGRSVIYRPVHDGDPLMECA
jgi:hypothetical protein